MRHYKTKGLEVTTMLSFGKGGRITKDFRDGLKTYFEPLVLVLRKVEIPVRRKVPKSEVLSSDEVI